MSSGCPTTRPCWSRKKAATEPVYQLRTGDTRQLYPWRNDPLLRCPHPEQTYLKKFEQQGECMDLQVISRDGEPEYAVLPWAQYQALLRAAGLGESSGSGPAAAAPPAQEGARPGLDQLSALRTAKGLELAQLARTVGISPSYLEMIENGTRDPDAAIKRSLAWELGVSGWRGDA